MKLILSRKGFDSAAGGGPSPILPDGRLISIPIPEPSERPGVGVPFSDIAVGHGATMADVMADLCRRPPNWQRGAHLDPDLDGSALPRPAGWRPIFGQCAAAQAHLDNQDVGVGDVFVFFGLFRQARAAGARLRWSPSAPRVHAAFGWLQVGEQHRNPQLDAVPWAAAHPHLRDPARPANTVYVAAPQLSFAPSLPGAGLFRWSDRCLLTSHRGRTSDWRLPSCFAPRTGFRSLTYHDRGDRWRPRPDGQVDLSAVGRGQEFVTDLDDRVLHEWLLPLLSESACSPEEAG